MEWSYLVIPLITLATAASGSLFVSRDVNVWYTAINKPRWTPPGWFIGIAWTLIYMACAVSALIVWNVVAHTPVFWAIIGTFLLNAALNSWWCYLFFTQHRMQGAYYESAALLLTILVLVILIAPLQAFAAQLLVPYLIWVAGATYLNYRVWKMNP